LVFRPPLGCLMVSLFRVCGFFVCAFMCLS
jgi:hypothetical protein